MANIKSAIKRARQNKKIRAHNASQRSNLRTYVKRVLAAVATKDHKQAVESFKETQPVIDRAASHKIIHKNKAARLKSRLNLKVKQLAAS